MAFLAFTLLKRASYPISSLLFCYNTIKLILYILHLQSIIIHALNLTQKKLNFLQNKKKKPTENSRNQLNAMIRPLSTILCMYMVTLNF